MANKKNSETRQTKSADRILINLKLLEFSFLLFTFIAAVSPDLLKNNIFLALQLTLSIPLFMSSTFARQKISYVKKKHEDWDTYGFLTFILSYGFLVNSVGILLSIIVGVWVGISFFAMNMVGALSFTYMEVREDRQKLVPRIRKDLLFFIIIFLLGVLPSLGFFG